MKLSEALRAIQAEVDADAEPSHVFLAAGFTTEHLEIFLQAHLLRRPGGGTAEISTGIYGDLPGNLERARRSSSHTVAAIIEWPDLDPRLGLRRLGGWAPDKLPEIVSFAHAAAVRLSKMLSDIAHEKSLVVLLPTLPLPPVGFMCNDQAGSIEFRLHEAINQIALILTEQRNCRIVNPQRLDMYSPISSRHDVKADLHSGFPYTIQHASAVAESLARLIRPEQPKKALITDLDDTLWKGLLGETGVDGVSWNLDTRSQIHGLYQQLLAALADSGVLIAVASKNEPVLVAKAFEREDLILHKDKIFPFEVNWGRKSESVQRILSQWNIGPESVVFIDDSPIEIAEVAESHGQIECYLFPGSDVPAAYELLQRIRDLFGKDNVSEEDTIRRDSLRRAQAVLDTRQSVESFDVFLGSIKAELSFDWSMPPDDSRALELINKTNQFNLNGRRLDEGQWQALMADPDRRLLVLSYRDKFGPLGKIATLSGILCQDELVIDIWVMSCRAFSRRIEHACLRQLFDKFDLKSVSLSYVETERNSPVREFLGELEASTFAGPVKLSRKEFEARCPRLFHSNREI